MKAKMLMTAGLVVCFLSIILAQDSYRPYPGELGVALRARGIGPIKDNQFDGVFDLGLFDQPTLQVRYMKSDVLTFRFDIGVDGTSSKSTSKTETQIKPDSLRFVDMTLTSKKTDFIFAPGLEYHFAGTSRLDPYLGIQIPFRLVGKKTDVDRTETTYSKGIAHALEEVTVMDPGGLGFGVDILAGFNYFVVDRLALGLEYNLGYVSEKIGGTSSTTYHFESTANDGTSTMNDFEQTSEATNRESKFLNRGVLSFNIVFYFGDF
ncbi:MAG: hypothetical protein R2787_03935 [Saprospiraceae bacterium]